MYPWTAELQESQRLRFSPCQDQGGSLSAGGPERGSAGTAGTDTGSSRVERKHAEDCSRLFLLGGYATYFGDAQNYPLSEVWELSLGSSLKQVRAVCWGCGKVEAGLRRCSGTCGGAVVTCGSECLARVWNEGGHKHWCKKMAARAG